MNRQRGILGLTLAQGVVYAVAALAVVSFLTGTYFAILNKGKAVVQAKFDAYIATQAAETAKKQNEIATVVTEIETVYVDRYIKVKEKGDVVTRTVTEYIMVPDDAACELRNGFVRAHDAAATNTPAGPPADSDREPAGIALSQAAAAIAHNYNVAHLWREQALGCRAFYEALKAKVNAVVKP